MLSHLKRVWRGEEKLWKVFWLWGVLGNVPLLLYFSDRVGFIPVGKFHYNYAFIFGWLGGLYSIVSVLLLTKNRSNLNENNSNVLKFLIYAATFIFGSLLLIGSLASGSVFYTAMFFLGYLKN